MNHDGSSDNSDSDFMVLAAANMDVGRESIFPFFHQSDRAMQEQNCDRLFQNPPHQLRPAMESSRESLIVILKNVFWWCNHACCRILKRQDNSAAYCSMLCFLCHCGKPRSRYFARCLRRISSVSCSKRSRRGLHKAALLKKQWEWNEKWEELRNWEVGKWNEKWEIRKS